MNIDTNLHNVPKISVIIPVYNSEKYLGECLNSVIKQSLENIEIIIIDDGSKDKSPQLCDIYAQKDSRIIVIHQENKGICEARNAGLKIANGEYITFCDNDDIVNTNCYEICYKNAKRFNADVLRFRRKHIMIGRMVRVETSYNNFKNSIVSIKDWDDYMQIISKTGYGVWAGIYKRSIISSNKIIFDPRIKYGYEDNIFSSELYRFTQNVYLLNDELYNWIQRDTHSASKKKGYNVFLNRS